MFKRYFSGGLAATAALAPMVAATPVHAAPAQSPQQSPAPSATDPSTLESCTAMFGLTKDNGTLVSFHETVNGTATPVPHVPNDIVPVLTYDDGSGPVQCVPVLAWTDEASFDAFMDGDPGMFPYPGTPQYLVPGGGLLLDGGSIPTGTYTFEMVLADEFTSVWSITWTAGLDPYPWTDEDDLLADVITAIRAALPPEVQDAWDASTISVDDCTIVEDAPLLAALVELGGGIDVVGEPDYNDSCFLLIFVASQITFQLLLQNNVVPVVLDSGEGGSSPAVPVVGSSPTPLVLTASALAALGAGMVFAGRRRRQPA